MDHKSDRELTPNEQALVERCEQLARKHTGDPQCEVHVRREEIQVAGQPRRAMSCAYVIYKNSRGVLTSTWERKRKDGTEMATEGSEWWAGADTHHDALQALRNQLEAFSGPLL